MAARLVLIVSLLFYVADSELVNKKLCKNVNTVHCGIHNVDVSPCPDGPDFCIFRRGKLYSLTVDYTPRFNANKLKVSILSDDSKTDTYQTEVLAPSDACQSNDCVIQENIKQNFNATFKLSGKSHGKVPIKVKLWNEENETQMCCFTFKVRMLKRN